MYILQMGEIGERGVGGERDLECIKIGNQVCFCDGIWLRVGFGLSRGKCKKERKCDIWRLIYDILGCGFIREVRLLILSLESKLRGAVCKRVF